MYIVTGGAGFIGSNLVAALEASGRGPLAVVDRLGTDDKWKNLRRRNLEELVDPAALQDLLERHNRDIRAVVHMGAISSTTERDVDAIVEINLRLSQQLWRWCSLYEIPFIYASSAATYGDGSNGFDDDASPDALARLVPLNAYGWSKHAFDRWVVRTLAGESGGAHLRPGTVGLRAGEPRPPQWVGLKFFNVYGPNEHHKGSMTSVAVRAYPGAAAGSPIRLFRSNHPDYPDGGQMRDFIYVKDCVDAILWILDNPDVNGLYNLGTGRAQTWLDVANALYGAVGRPLAVEWVDTPVEIRDRYQYFTQAEMGRLRSVGYDKPFRSVEEGIRDLVENHLSRKDPYV